MVVVLAYGLGLLLAECLFRVRTRRDTAGMAGAALSPGRYWAFRWGVLFSLLPTS